MSEFVTGSPWGDLRAGAHESSGKVPFIDAAPNSDVPLHYALWPGREAAFLVGLRQHEVLGRISHGSALTVQEAEANGRAWIILSCRERRLETVFERLCSRIRDLVLTEGAKGPEAVRRAVSEFRDLLVPGRGGAPRWETVLGLLGELHVLERMLAHCPNAVEAWVGPMGERHDFRGVDGSVEVKTTCGPDGHVVTISSFSQLVLPEDGDLWLAHVALEEPGARRLCDIVSAVEAVTGDPEPLRSRLRQVGIVDPSDPNWNEVSVDCTAIAVYRVDEGFPAITPSAFRGGRIPRGVVDAGYRIDLSACSSFLVDPSKVGTVWESVCGGRQA